MKIVLLQFVLLCSSVVMAHPVSFSDSIGIMGAHSENQTHLQVNYSWKYWFATGVHNIQRVSDEKNISLLSANFLAKRWNTDRFQANLYGLLGAGQSEWGAYSESVYFTGAQFDIEDRKHYFLTKYKQVYNDDNTHYSNANIRLGFAPYVGSFNDLHIWYILDYSVEKYLGGEEKYALAPTLRFYYENVLWELSAPINGGLGFKYIIHY